MNSQDVVVLCLWCLIVGVPLALGYRWGFRRGKALGWQEHYFECVARDRARRQRNGQFKAKEKTA